MAGRRFRQQAGAVSGWTGVGQHDPTQQYVTAKKLEPKWTGITEKRAAPPTIVLTTTRQARFRPWSQSESCGTPAARPRFWPGWSVARPSTARPARFRSTSERYHCIKSYNSYNAQWEGAAEACALMRRAQDGTSQEFERYVDPDTAAVEAYCSGRETEQTPCTA